jgi:RimJ/RimL family protein N-acetyltransferase
MTVTLRRAARSDVPEIRRLVTHPEVEPFLSVIRATDDEELAAEIERSEAEPDAFGVLMILRDRLTVGVVYFERVNRRSRIVRIGGLAIDPAVAGQGIGLGAVETLVELLLGELDFHRIEAETYGYNTRAQTLFERAGFTREGVRRQAYWRNDGWVDGVCFGLLEQALDPPPSRLSG